MKVIYLCLLFITTFFISNAYARAGVDRIPIRFVDQLEPNEIIEKIFEKEIIEGVQDEGFEYPQIVYKNLKTQQLVKAYMLPIIEYSDVEQITERSRENEEPKPYYLAILVSNPQDTQGNFCNNQLCEVVIDFLLFRKTERGYVNYQPSRNSIEEKLTVIDGKVDIDIEQLKKNIQPFGKEILGSYFNVYSLESASGVKKAYTYTIQLSAIRAAIYPIRSDLKSKKVKPSSFVKSSVEKINVVPGDAKYYDLKVFLKDKGKITSKMYALFSYSDDKTYEVFYGPNTLIGVKKIK